MRSEQSGLCAAHNRLYKIWHSMLNRCNNAGHANYKNYGGRGIEVCGEWVSFKSFCAWALANGYEDSKTIDRIDNDRGYSSKNCRWADKKTQARNRRTNVMYEYNGVSKTLPEWAEVYDLNVITLVSRVVRMGWPMEKALNTRPASKTGFYEIKGQSKHLREWAAGCGISPEALYLRMKRGKSLSQAIGASPC